MSLVLQAATASAAYCAVLAEAAACVHWCSQPHVPADNDYQMHDRDI